MTRLRRAVCDAALRFDTSALDRRGAAVAVEEWGRIAHAADAAMALAAARVAVCGPPADAGMRDAAELVARATGVTAGKAREVLVRGEALAVQESTRVAATGGLLSPAAAAAITDAVAVNPTAEPELLEVAGRASLGELRLACANRKAEAQDLAAIECRVHARRSVRRWRDADGAEHLHATGTRRDLASIDRALKQLVDERFKRARAEGTFEPLEAYAFDALTALADRVLEPRVEDVHGRVVTRDPIRYLAILRADLPALARGRVEAGETCELAGLGPVSIATAREMLGEAVLKVVLTRGTDVRNVTHLGRGPNTAQKIALLWEQPVCQREGCGRRARLEYDHIAGREFRLTRHSRVDELTPLCGPDHDLKTNLGWALVAGTGIRPMVPPSDPRHPRHPPRAGATDPAVGVSRGESSGGDHVGGRIADTVSSVLGGPVRPP